MNQYSYSQIMMDLLEIAQFDLWEHAFLKGFDSEFDEKMTVLYQNKARQEDLMALLKKRYERYSLNMQYIHIIQKKYGLQKVNKLDIHKDILPQLKKNERDLIELEYEKKLKN